jgi:hypothetical protein
VQLPGFIDTSNFSQSRIANPEVTINWYLEPLARNSKNGQALYPTPGQRAWGTAPVADVGTRALFSMNDRVLGVIGSTLYDLFADGTLGPRGTVNKNSNPATINMNGRTPLGLTGNEAFITSNNDGYVLNLATNVFTKVLTGKALMGASLDTYFLALDPPSNRFSISNAGDGLTWDPTQFGQRQDQPDEWKAMVVNTPDLWLVGGKTGCIWFDTGDFPFPFAPRPGATFQYGIRAPFTLKVVGDSVLWLSENADGIGLPVRATGYTPEPISTPTVDTAIEEYQRNGGIDDARAFSYQQAGHLFYVLNFTQGTWVYDLTADRWHQRGQWVPSSNDYLPWRPCAHAAAYGRNLVGDANSGQISWLDLTWGTEADGSAIRRKRIGGGTFNENKPIEHRRVEFLLEMGLGTSVGQGSDPMIMIRASDNGGKTWGNEHQLSVGKMGEFTKRAYLTRLGIPLDRVYELTVTDPIPYRVLDAFLNNESVA